MAKVQSCGISIYYETEGSGLPVVMVHGWSGSIGWWREFGYTEPLRDRYKLILIDLRGHGQSEIPASEEAYDTELMAQDVLAVMDALAVPRAHFLGYSMGGWIGFELGLLAPERFASMVLGGAHPYPEDLSAFREMARQGGSAIAAMWESNGVRVSDDLKAQLLSHHRLPLAALVRRDRHDLSGALSKMEMPVLLYAGDKDWRHDGMKQCASELPRARFVSLPGLDHLTGISRNEVATPLIRAFLDEQMP